MSRTLLITGATGKQGGAVIKALLSQPTPTPFRILALTRDKNSKQAQRLASNKAVTLVEGTLNDCPALFKGLPEQPWGVFSVQLPLPSAESEERQGKALVDSAAAAGVKHFVYTSNERGANGENDPTFVKHFISKYNIEKHLKAVAEGQGKDGMTWTILRPVAFMENLTDDFLGRAFVAMWKLNGLDEKLQLVTTNDVGKIGAEAFLKPEEYKNRAISIAGDELSPKEANAIFKEEFGRDLPATFNFLGRLIRLGLREQLGDMFDWFKKDGFAVDMKKMREEYPDMEDFRYWLRNSSQFRKSS